MKGGGSHRPRRPPPASFISLAHSCPWQSFFLTFSCASVPPHPRPPPPKQASASVWVHLFSCSGDTSEASSARSPAVFFLPLRRQSLSDGAIGSFGQDTSLDWLSTVQNTAGLQCYDCRRSFVQSIPLLITHTH